MASSIFLTIDDLKTFHTIDRELYTRLVIDLGRDLMQSMEMIALWIWLEEVGYPNLILKMQTLPNQIINAIAEEAQLCLHCIASRTPPLPPTDSISYLPVTLTLMEGNSISLEYLFQNRERAVMKILTTVNTVCTNVFNDIVQQVLSLSNQAPNLNLNNNIIRNNITNTEVNPNLNLVGPGLGPGPEGQLLQPIVFGSGIIAVPTLGTATGVYGGASGKIIGTGESSLSAQSTLNPMAEPYNPMNVVIGSNEIVEEEVIPPEDRTMFITFSRGYPILEQEVRDFFNRRYGECVEDIRMQKVEENKQPLFAHVVFYTASKMSEILEGKQKVKFTIDGRHILARRHEPKRKMQ
ncbi:hypothetical protein BVC80_1707g74 [Macleaya cordata]|uniref:RNA recognition motif domain n=1 Tax=Macleaya cordata TaxID=56857 RepID=A0A200Q659_MACCD|nr:hypothetical protein BVC80_1707g74 [Macleaya cordata]